MSTDASSGMGEREGGIGGLEGEREDVDDECTVGEDDVVEEEEVFVVGGGGGSWIPSSASSGLK